MFTGIIKDKSKIENIQGNKFFLKSEKIASNLKLGSSVAVNGVCLTVSKKDKNMFSVEMMPETKRVTTLEGLKRGDQVNLEPALSIGEELGGHFVTGHIDGVGKISKIEKEKDGFILEIVPPSQLMKYIVYKGSIALDGVSLTVAQVKKDRFSVALIPYTLKMTTLSDKKTEDKLNIEVDMMAKYLERLLQKQTKIDKNFLKKHGFTNN
jgi:riboflavin synthase